jgi:hypothetical protein
MFLHNERYKITFNDGEELFFTVQGNENVFHLKQIVTDSGESMKLFELLLKKDWEKVEPV